MRDLSDDKLESNQAILQKYRIVDQKQPMQVYEEDKVSDDSVGVNAEVYQGWEVRKTLAHLGTSYFADTNDVAHTTPIQPIKRYLRSSTNVKQVRKLDFSNLLLTSVNRKERISSALRKSVNDN